MIFSVKIVHFNCFNLNKGDIWNLFFFLIFFCVYVLFFFTVNAFNCVIRMKSLVLQIQKNKKKQNKYESFGGYSCRWPRNFHKNLRNYVFYVVHTTKYFSFRRIINENVNLHWTCRQHTIPYNRILIVLNANNPKRIIICKWHQWPNMFSELMRVNRQPDEK